MPEAPTPEQQRARIEYLMEEHSGGITAFAKDAGLSRVLIRKFLNGRTTHCSAKTIRALAEYDAWFRYHQRTIDWEATKFFHRAHQRGAKKTATRQQLKKHPQSWRQWYAGIREIARNAAKSPEHWR